MNPARRRGLQWLGLQGLGAGLGLLVPGAMARAQVAPAPTR